jgi:hypothetical protein
MIIKKLVSERCFCDRQKLKFIFTGFDKVFFG